MYNILKIMKMLFHTFQHSYKMAVIVTFLDFSISVQLFSFIKQKKLGRTSQVNIHEVKFACTNTDCNF